MNAPGKDYSTATNLSSRAVLMETNEVSVFEECSRCTWFRQRHGRGVVLPGRLRRAKREADN